VESQSHLADIYILIFLLLTYMLIADPVAYFQVRMLRLLPVSRMIGRRVARNINADRVHLSIYMFLSTRHKLIALPIAFRPETTILGANPGTCFVHRNIANVITATHISATAVIEYAVNALQIKHIILCGRTGRGGCKASLGNAKVGKRIPGSCR
jgi:hypothetical protein